MDRLEEGLRSLGSSVGDCLEEAVLSGGLMIQDQGEKNAPYKSGTLKSSIITMITSKGRTRVEGVVGPTGVPYAKIQEYGGLTGRGHRTRIQGKFYMTRAVQMRKREAEEEMVRVISEGFNR